MLTHLYSVLTKTLTALGNAYNASIRSLSNRLHIGIVVIYKCKNCLALYEKFGNCYFCKILNLKLNHISSWKHSKIFCDIVGDRKQSCIN